MQKPFDRSYTIVSDKLYAGYYAGGSDKKRTLEKMQILYNAGIRSLVNLTESEEIRVDRIALYQLDEALEEFNLSKEDKLEHKRFSIKDMSIPTEMQMRNILAFIDEKMEEKKPIYLFCCGGYGRTGTVSSAYVLRHNLATNDNVFDVLQELRKEDITHNRPSPQRRIQKQFVLSHNWK